MSTNGLSFESINSTVYNAVQSRENDLRSRIEAIGSQENPGSLDLLLMQQEVQQWSMMIQIQSTLVKELGDAMKGIVQKAG